MDIRELGDELRARGRTLVEALDPRETVTRAGARLREVLPSTEEARHALERIPHPGALWEGRRPDWEPTEALRLLFGAIVAGTIASAVSTAVLAVVARIEGRRAAQPVNATSHWAHGPEAGSVGGADLRHTALGYLTHHASTVFWALPFQWWLASRPRRSPAEIVAGAGVISALAAVVDYGLLARRAPRTTPGWEHALSPRGVAAGFGALALGLAAGGLVTEALRRR